MTAVSAAIGIFTLNGVAMTLARSYLVRAPVEAPHLLSIALIVLLPLANIVLYRGSQRDLLSGAVTR